MRPLQLGLAVAAGILFSALFSFAWTGPTSSPPNGNADAPINVGTTAQFKNGNIGLYGNLLLAANGGSYLNFGATSGSDGYGIRDNNGTLEFKSIGLAGSVDLTHPSGDPAVTPAKQDVLPVDATHNAVVYGRPELCA